jgi:hypothetical protein
MNQQSLPNDCVNKLKFIKISADSITVEQSEKLESVLWTSSIAEKLSIRYDHQIILVSTSSKSESFLITTSKQIMTQTPAKPESSQARTLNYPTSRPTIN